MLTNNYLILQSYFSSNVYGPPNDVVIPGAVKFDGNPPGAGFYNLPQYSNTTNPNAQIRTRLSVVLGAGDTAPAITDYCLENDISDSLNMSQSVNVGAEGDAIKVVFSVSGTNSTENEITIKEFGIAKEYYVHDTEGMAFKKFLIARELLKTPKVVGAGEPFTITFEWSGS